MQNYRTEWSENEGGAGWETGDIWPPLHIHPRATRSFCLLHSWNLAAARSPRLLHPLHRLPETPGCCQGPGRATSGAWESHVRGLAVWRQGPCSVTLGAWESQVRGLAACSCYRGFYLDDLGQRCWDVGKTEKHLIPTAFLWEKQKHCEDFV